MLLRSENGYDDEPWMPMPCRFVRCTYIKEERVMKKLVVAGMLAAMMASLCACAGNAHTVSTGSTSAASQNSEAVSENSSEAVSQSAATDVGEITEENFMDFPTTDESEFETYSVDGGVCIKYCSSDDPVIVVPETINGETVVALADTVFFGKTVW